MRGGDDVIEQFEGLFAECWDFEEKFAEKSISDGRGKEVVDNRTWRMGCDVGWRVEMKGLTLACKGPETLGEFQWILYAVLRERSLTSDDSAGALSRRSWGRWWLVGEQIYNVID